MVSRGITEDSYKSQSSKPETKNKEYNIFALQIIKKLNAVLNSRMSTTETQVVTSQPKVEPVEAWKPQAPLKLSGALDSFKSFDVTPIIGREFTDVNLK